MFAVRGKKVGAAAAAAAAGFMGNHSGDLVGLTEMLGRFAVIPWGFFLSSPPTIYPLRSIDHDDSIARNRKHCACGHRKGYIVWRM